MKSITIYPSALNGTIAAIPSKSEAQRSIICAALASLGGGRSEINGLTGRGELSDDIKAAIRCICTLTNARIERIGQTVALRPRGGEESCKDILDVGESAAVLRFLIPISIALKGGAVFKVGSMLRRRPLDEYLSSLRAAHTWEKDYLIVKGRLKPGEYNLRGDISSQNLSGLLMASPLLDGYSAINIIGPVSSYPYVELTISIMAHFGVKVERSGSIYSIDRNQAYRPAQFSVGGDWSYAAFFIAANAMGGAVNMTGLDCGSLQADRAISSLIDKDKVDVDNTPDLFPALASAACAKKSDTVLYNAARLRSKESDRLSAMAVELKKLGADIDEETDRVIIKGKGELRGGDVDSHGDHRVAMALAIATCICCSPTRLYGYDAVKKSAPAFFADFKRLGGVIHEHLGQ